MNTTSYEIQGRTVQLPVRVRDGDSWSAQFFVPASAAQAIVDPAGLQALRLLPRRAALIVAFARYRDSDLGPYEELAVTLLVRRRDTSARRASRRGRAEIGIYMHQLAQSQPLAVESSRAIWGYPSFLASVQITAGDGRVACSVAREGRQVLKIAARQGGLLKLTETCPTTRCATGSCASQRGTRRARRAPA
jgi:hypothetical protein